MIDPTTNTADYTSHYVPSQFTKWFGGVSVGNTIYGIPFSFDAVLKIDITC
eukprot:m.105715 g.105715  ORF g.105715 m.105715 type:complete len:51 (+) comp9136_c1_seq9:361-513(+)